VIFLVLFTITNQLKRNHQIGHVRNQMTAVRVRSDRSCDYTVNRIRPVYVNM